MFLSIYRVYIIEIYKGKHGGGKKVAGKVRCGKEYPLYRYSIIGERKVKKGRGKDMFIIYI